MIPFLRSRRPGDDQESKTQDMDSEFTHVAMTRCKSLLPRLAHQSELLNATHKLNDKGHAKNTEPIPSQLGLADSWLDSTPTPPSRAE